MKESPHADLKIASPELTISAASDLRRMAHPPCTHCEHSTVLTRVELLIRLGTLLIALLMVSGAPRAASIVRRVEVTQRVLLLLVL